MPFEVFAEDGATVVKCLVNMLTITHFEQGQQGNLIVHVISGRVLITNISFDDFVNKQNNRSSILTPVR